MLFIIAIDVLGRMISKAEEEGILQPLSTQSLQHRISIHADDLILFIRPAGDDINITLDILHLFGEASRLCNNAQKRSVFPIQISNH